MPTRVAEEADLRSYIQVFLAALQEAAQRHLPEETQAKLAHLSLLPASVTCYVSRSYGVAFEYFKSPITTVSTVSGDRPAEQLLFGFSSLPERVATGVDITDSRADFSGVSFINVLPLRLAGPRTHVRLEDVRFTFGGRHQYIYFAEIFGDNSVDCWTEKQAVLRASDEVLAAAVELAHARRLGQGIDEFINHSKQKTVLLLGSYTEPGLARLTALAAALGRLGYFPIRANEVPEHPDHNLEQHVGLLAGLARFVILDDSEPAGQIAEVRICRDNGWITAVLRVAGSRSSYMTQGVSAYSRVVREAEYLPPPIETAVVDAAQWAEGEIARLRNANESTYPWRIRRTGQPGV